MGTQVSERSTGMNQALVFGQLVAEVERRELPSGSVAASFSLTVRSPGQKTTSVPMVWYDPPATFDKWQLGDMVAVSGPVVRRFYQAGGRLGSSTEVVVSAAQRVGPRTKTLRPFVDGEACLHTFLAAFSSK